MWPQVNQLFLLPRSIMWMDAQIVTGPYNSRLGLHYRVPYRLPSVLTTAHRRDAGDACVESECTHRSAGCRRDG